MSNEVINNAPIDLVGSIAAPGYAQAGASVLSAVAGIASARQANRQSQEEAQRNRDWQKMMSDTAHQREVADLVKAGLNPALSATGGSGASSGSGAMAPIFPEVSEKTQSTIQSSARDIASYAADMAQKKANVVNTDADSALKDQQASTAKTQAGLNVAQAALSGAKTESEPTARALMRSQGILALENANLAQETQKLQQTQQLVNTANAKNISLESQRRSSELPALKQEYEFRHKYNPVMLPAHELIRFGQAGLNMANSAKDLVTPKFRLQMENDFYKGGRNRIGL